MHRLSHPRFANFEMSIKIMQTSIRRQLNVLHVRHCRPKWIVSLHHAIHSSQVLHVSLKKKKFYVFFSIIHVNCKYSTELEIIMYFVFCSKKDDFYVEATGRRRSSGKS